MWVIWSHDEHPRTVWISHAFWFQLWVLRHGGSNCFCAFWCFTHTWQVTLPQRTSHGDNHHDAFGWIAAVLAVSAPLSLNHFICQILSRLFDLCRDVHTVDAQGRRDVPRVLLLFWVCGTRHVRRTKPTRIAKTVHCTLSVWTSTRRSTFKSSTWPKKHSPRCWQWLRGRMRERHLALILLPAEVRSWRWEQWNARTIFHHFFRTETKLRTSFLQKFIDELVQKAQTLWRRRAFCGVGVFTMSAAACSRKCKVPEHTKTNQQPTTKIEWSFCDDVLIFCENVGIVLLPRSSRAASCLNVRLSGAQVCLTWKVNKCVCFCFGVVFFYIFCNCLYFNHLRCVLSEWWIKTVPCVFLLWCEKLVSLFDSPSIETNTRKKTNRFIFEFVYISLIQY